MPRYTYQARDENGKLTRGSLRAANEERAGSLLRAHKLSPIAIVAAEDAPFWQREFGIFSISTKDLILFTRQMASMIRAGVPIIETIRAIEDQVQKRAFKKILEEMAYDIEAGDSLSNAMSKHSKAFNPFILGIVRTGEASGRLSESLNSISDYLEQDYAFVRKVRAALAYPVFVLVVVVILTIVMFTFVLPQLVGLFADSGVQLPWPTRVLIGVTTFVQSYWILLLVVAAAAFVLARSYFRTPEGRYTLSTWALRAPVLSTLFQKMYLARLTSILHTLFSSDVPALDSLALAREAVGNKVYQRILSDTIKSIKDGSSISYVWRHEPYIPSMLTAMVAVGERSGEIQTAFSEASRFFKRDVDTILESITVLLEPLLIVILGIGVGIVVGAVLLPIYNLVLVI
ncbi:MAG: type II secretion system F family protein [Candidatus Andersenbacteria bacterium]